VTNYATYAGLRITHGVISIPYVGLWAADVKLADSTVAPSRGSVVLGSLTLVGALGRSGALGGSRGIAVNGGAGGWRTTIPALGYANSAGVRLATILEDVAREIGETVAGYSTSDTVGAHYARHSGVAAMVLRDLCPIWWVRPDGVTTTEARSTAAISTPFQIESRDGANGKITVSTERPDDWMPGRTFAGPTMPDAQSIAHTFITCDEGGKLRVEVLVQ
jgi:hypothetical protein